jgi:dihydropteroate synthase
LTKRKPYSVPLPGGRTLDLGSRTLVMGIINVTPDSFADGGLRFDPVRAIADGLQMIAEGADILDVGGESTRPGAEPVPEVEELRRVVPVISELSRRTNVPLCVDTYKAAVAQAAVAAGASIVNDISGLQYDKYLAHVVADTGAAVVLMHHRGTVREMYKAAIYDHVILEIAKELGHAIDRAEDAGVEREAIIIDPGFGFAKRPEHTYEALAQLDQLHVLDRPLLAGPSRKSFLDQAVGERLPSDRDWATAAAVTAASLLGAHIVRVHAVKEMVQIVRVADRIREAAQ